MCWANRLHFPVSITARFGAESWPQEYKWTYLVQFLERVLDWVTQPEGALGDSHAMGAQVRRQPDGPCCCLWWWYHFPYLSIIYLSIYISIYPSIISIYLLSIIHLLPIIHLSSIFLSIIYLPTYYLFIYLSIYYLSSFYLINLSTYLFI